MATAVDICNLALSALGDEATVTSIDPAEGSRHADHCARFYPVCRDELLAQHAWNFATIRVQLARLNSVPAGDENTYAFAFPAKCLRLVGVYGQDPSTQERYIPYRVEVLGQQTVILAKAEKLWARYISSETPTSRFPPQFTTALVHRLAVALCGPVIPGTTGMSVAQNQMKLCEFHLARAIQADADQTRDYSSYRTPYAYDFSDWGDDSAIY